MSFIIPDREINNKNIPILQYDFLVQIILKAQGTTHPNISRLREFTL